MSAKSLRQSPVAWSFVWLLIVLGVVARLAPLANQDGRLLSQWPTEDGYYMLTISRELGLGNGMSTADGSMVTNGVQPLATLLWALPYALLDGDKTASIAAVLLLEFIFACLSAWMLYRLALRLLPASAGRDPRWLPALATGLWFASAPHIANTMNTLETGLYVMTVLAMANLLLQPRNLETLWRLRRSLAVGVLLGVVFLSRNDGAFFILSCCLTYLFMGWRGRWSRPLQRLPQVLVFGVVSMLVALPWLIFNYTTFGHIMPISGISEGMSAQFGSNINHLPQVLVEVFLVILPIPEKFQKLPVVIGLCWALIPVLLVIVVMAWRRANALQHQAFLLIGIYLLLLSSFYGLYFGAPHFMARYLFPTTPFITLFSVAVCVYLLDLLSRRGLPLHMLVGLLAVAVVGLVNWRTYQLGVVHPHHHTLAWVKAHASEETWIGAAQTGYLGYFHDRTLNLDGKVNFAALQARLQEEKDGEPGALQRYVINDTKIEYLVDWYGLLVWMKLPVMQQNFRVLVADPVANLTVLQRLPAQP
ncbi:MAG: glycosyltransferase family 39 protein [Pseudomonadota bacterium]